MNQPAFNRLLFAVILVMTVIPLAGAVYFVDRVLETSLNLGFNSQIMVTLNDASANVKKLGHLDPQHQSQYRQQFQQIEELRDVYGSRDLIKRGVHRSLVIYFLLGVAAALALSLALAMLLTRKISSSYQTNFAELSKHRERIRYLEEISSWQEFAKILAHEIKNPLTPIEVLVTSLVNAYHDKPQDLFFDQLQRTEAIVLEEVGLPKVELAVADVGAVVKRHLEATGHTFSSARIDLVAPSEPLLARIDGTLFRQALTNLVRNGVEANPNREVQFFVTVTLVDGRINISVENDGTPVGADIAPRIFDPYITSKSGDDNIGLGLAVVRKILIEHGGDICYAEKAGRPAFVITIPRVA